MIVKLALRTFMMLCSRMIWTWTKNLNRHRIPFQFVFLIQNDSTWEMETFIYVPICFSILWRKQPLNLNEAFLLLNTVKLNLETLFSLKHRFIKWVTDTATVSSTQRNCVCYFLYLSGQTLSPSDVLLIFSILVNFHDTLVERNIPTELGGHLWTECLNSVYMWPHSHHNDTRGLNQ